MRVLLKCCGTIFSYFQALFAVPTNTSFWDVFHKEVERFNEAVKHLSRDKVYALVVDPESEEILS